MFFQNYINIEGRLTKTPELQTSKNGKEYCRFTICYNQQKKVTGEEDKWESIPHFFNCVAFKYNAQSVSRMKKGEPVNVVGKLQFSQYTDRNGQNTTSVSILADNVKKIVIEKRNESNKATPEPDTSAGHPMKDIYMDSDEIPF